MKRIIRLLFLGTALLVLSAAPAAGRPKKVACVGASITAGHITDNIATDAYPAQLARMLGDGYEVRNFGISSCTMLRHGDYPYWTKGRLGEALASNPDIVFIDLGGNDSKPQNAVYIDKEFTEDAVFMVELFRSLPSRPRVILMTPSGKTFRQEDARRLAGMEHLIFVCGHYEGVDERVREALVTDELSIGDYVLTNGVLPAAVVVDAVVRLLPGVLGGGAAATQDESFTKPLLEYPQYTRPAVFRGMAVPALLQNGNHAEVDAWHMQQSIDRTARRRPDLLGKEEKESGNDCESD